MEYVLIRRPSTDLQRVVLSLVKVSFILRLLGLLAQHSDGERNITDELAAVYQYFMNGVTHGIPAVKRHEAHSGFDAESSELAHVELLTAVDRVQDRAEVAEKALVNSCDFCGCLDIGKEASRNVAVVGDATVSHGLSFHSRRRVDIYIFI